MSTQNINLTEIMISMQTQNHFNSFAGGGNKEYKKNNIMQNMFEDNIHIHIHPYFIQ